MHEFLTILNQPAIHWAGQTITIGQLLVIPAILIFGYFFTKWLSALLSKRMVARNVSMNIVFLVRRLVFVIAWIIIIITILDIINVPLTAFAFISGAVAIGVGFGLQNIINNFISGWILMWEQPIRIGDFLEFNNEKGVVEEINTRSTLIKRVDGVHMLVPNSTLLENTVVNWYLLNKEIRTNVRVGVAYGSDVRLVEQLMQQAVAAQPEVLTEKETKVLFDDFGDNALMFDVFFWTDGNINADLRVIRSNIRFEITRRFKEHDIEIAFPQRDVHIDGAITVKRDA